MNNLTGTVEHISTEVKEQVGWVWLDRPAKRNALSPDMWRDLPPALSDLGAREDVRVVVVAGRGPSFTVGIDLEMLSELAPEGRSEVESRRLLYETISRLQTTMSAFAECPHPVIAAVHGHCLGAGMDLITACDIRLASSDAVFSVRETRLALVADVGTLQRLPAIVGGGRVAELVYTGDDFDSAYAERIGLVNHVYPDVETLHEAAGDLASKIAANSPLALKGSKAILAAGSDLTTAQALDKVALWNAAFLHSDDLTEALAAHTEGRPPRFTGV